MSNVGLVVDWCNHKAAKYACERWHYSRRMYVNKTLKLGVWENGTFVGAVVFGTGCQHIGGPFGISNFKICELVRVALSKHEFYVTEIISTCLKKIKYANPGLRLVVSFSDTNQNHHGGIYQAGNWIYVGYSTGDTVYKVNGEIVHPRTMHNRYGKGGQSIEWLRTNVDHLAERVEMKPKHKYIYPLDKAMRRQIEPLAQPYPKRADVGEMESRADSIG